LPLGRELRGPLSAFADTFQKMEPQIFHLGKARPTDGDLKFNTDDAKAVFDWIEGEMKKFVDALRQTKDGEFWAEDRSSPPPEDGPGTHIYVDDSHPSASSGKPTTIGYTMRNDPLKK
jgi:hypothetical protein